MLSSLSLTALALLPCAPLPSTTTTRDDPAIERARDLFSAPEEAGAREASQLCAKADSPEAVELLLEVLGKSDGERVRGWLTSGHYRDVAWEGLVQIHSQEARQVVADLLDSKEKDPYLRAWCCKLIGIWKQVEQGGIVLDQLKEKDPLIRRAAALALGRIPCPEAVAALKKLVRHKDAVLRANAMDSLARIDPAVGEEAFLAGLKDSDAGVACALLGVLPELYPARNELLSTQALRHEDWRPRIQAVENLSAIETKTAVDALLVALDDGRPRVVERTVEGLQALTRQPHRRAEAWRHWWADNRESFTFGGKLERGKASDEPRTHATYNGIPVTSDHVIFLIDKSQTMTEPLTSRKTSKDMAALEELDNVLTKLLDSGLTFNVWVYNERLDVLFENKPKALVKKTYKEAMRFVEGQSNTGMKDIWQALETVTQDPTIDTIYLLSSGEPEAGLYVHWNRLTDYLQDINRFRKIVVNSVAYSDNKYYRDQLERIAQVTGGRFQFYE